MAVVAQVCPKCGAAIQFNEGQDEVVCTYCGAMVVKSTDSSTGVASLEKEVEADKLSRETIERQERLSNKGLTATAKILTVQSTGIIRNLLDGKGVLMSFTVEVQPDKGVPFNANAKTFVGLVAINKYQPGTMLDVFYDPKDQTQVSVAGRHGVPDSNPYEKIKAELKAAASDKKDDNSDSEDSDSGTENDGSVKAWNRLKKAQSLADASDTEDSDGDTENEDTDEDEVSTPAGGKPRKARKVPVPDKFNPVTDLGPAMVVYRHHGGGVDLIAAVTQGEVKELVRYLDGMAFLTRGKKIHIWRWSEVATILTDITVTYPYYLAQRYILLKSSGEKLILDEFLDDVEHLIQLIKNKVYARLYPPLAKQYDEGQAVTFGPVTVQRANGLTMGGKTYSWADIIEVKVHDGRLTARTRNDLKHEVHTKDIPNVELLCKLIGVKLDSYDLHG
jgi:DNA-directed RNA polymerase subunit RPC12/RpoP